MQCSKPVRLQLVKRVKLCVAAFGSKLTISKFEKRLRFQDLGMQDTCVEIRLLMTALTFDWISSYISNVTLLSFVF